MFESPHSDHPLTPEQITTVSVPASLFLSEFIIFIGATIVGITTTLPRMIVSVMASVEGKNDMAVGNAIGPVIANTGLIPAIAFVFLRVQRRAGRPAVGRRSY